MSPIMVVLPVRVTVPRPNRVIGTHQVGVGVLRGHAGPRAHGLGRYHDAHANFESSVTERLFRPGCVKKTLVSIFLTTMSR